MGYLWWNIYLVIMSKLIEDLERIVAEDELRLRDHFAGLAMKSFLNNDYTSTFEIVASDAYTVADAMLKARKEVKP